MKTNSLIYKANKEYTEGRNSYSFTATIRLDDQCKNGHQDFSATGDIRENGKEYMGGCVHEEILKHFPELAPFVKLHLCDYLGAPMYPSANGLYHIQKGFNRTKPSDKSFKDEYCEYYRITPAQFDVLSLSENQNEFAILLDELGILAQWKVEANAAIKQLEALTGDEFVMDSKRSQHTPPTTEEIALFRARTAAGYYTPEAKAQRAIDAKAEAKLKAISKLETSAGNKIAEIKTELNINLCFLRNDISIDNMIIYGHRQEIVFNWQDSQYKDRYTQDELQRLVANIHTTDGAALAGYTIAIVIDGKKLTVLRK